MRRLGLMAAVVAVLIAVPAAAQPQRPPELARAEDGYFQTPIRVAAGVWVLAQTKFQVQPCGNVTVIEQADGLILVDAGGSPGDGRRIVGMVRALSAKPVKAVIITDWHGDRPQGLSEILEAWPRARTIATATTQAHLGDPATRNTPAHPDPAANAAFQKKVQGFAEYMRDSGAKATDPRERAGWAAGERLFNQYALDMDGAVTLQPQEGFDRRLALADRDSPVDALFLGRANTDGDAVVWLPRQKILITGDVVVTPFPYGYRSYPAEWLQVLAKLRRFHFKTLIPGHGLPQHDDGYLDKLAAALRDIRAQVAPLAAQGLTLGEVQRRVDAKAQARAFIGDDPWLRIWFDNYWIGPIVTSAYKEAKGEPIVQSLG